MSLTVARYVKQFYRGNLFGADASERSGRGANELISVDVKAIRRAVKDLGGYDYKEGEGSELMNKVQAFVNTYNNYVDSAKGVDDSNANRYLSKLKKLTREHADEFKEIGITIQSSGKLKVDKKELQDTGRYQVSKLFDKDSEYSLGVDKWMKRTNNMILRTNLSMPRKSTSAKAAAAQEAAGTAQAGAGAAGTAQAAAMFGAAGVQAGGMDMQLAQQLGLALEGNRIDYSV